MSQTDNKPDFDIRTAAESLIELQSSIGLPFTAEHEEFHPSVPPGDPMWGETSWWAVTSPEHKLIVWVYIMFRRNLGLASVSIQVWNDNNGPEERSMLYSKRCVHAPVAEEASLLSLRFEAPGPDLSIDIVEPLKRYQLNYSDGDELVMDLAIRGYTEMIGTGISETRGHADQVIWCKGMISVSGKELTVDCPGIRDRSWSQRAEFPTSDGGSEYSWGANEQGLSFLGAGMLDADFKQASCFGFIVRDGVTARVETFKRTIVDRDADGSPRTFDVALTDTRGRTIKALGTRLCHGAPPSWAGMSCWINLLRWEFDDGAVACGEDHEGFSNRLWNKLRQG